MRLRHALLASACLLPLAARAAEAPAEEIPREYAEWDAEGEERVDTERGRHPPLTP